VKAGIALAPAVAVVSSLPAPRRTGGGKPRLAVPDEVVLALPAAELTVR
jgi:hypothetical protein